MKVKFDTFFQGSLQYSFKIAPFFRLSDIDINLSKNRRRSKHIRKPSLCLAAVSNPDVDGLSEVSVPTAGGRVPGISHFRGSAAAKSRRDDDRYGNVIAVSFMPDWEWILVPSFGFDVAFALKWR